MKKTRVLLIVMAFTIVAAACSPQGDSGQVATLDPDATQETPGTASDDLADTEEAMIAYTQCLRDQGIDIEDPVVGADGSVQLSPIEFTVDDDGTGDAEPDVSKFEELIAPCEELLGGTGSLGSAAGDAEFADAMLEYAQCMRDNGVDMPDPDLSDDGIINLGDVDGAAFESADAVCRDAFTSLSGTP